MDRIATARQFKERARKTHVLRSGLPIEYRFVSVDMLTARGVLPPGLLGAGKEDAEGVARTYVAEDPGAIARLVDGVLSAGLTSPLVWSGDADSCPEDHILVSDLAEGRWEAFEVILRHSDMDSDVVRTAAFRRGQPGVGRGDRPDGPPAGDDGSLGAETLAGGVGARAGGADDGDGGAAGPDAR